MIMLIHSDWTGGNVLPRTFSPTYLIVAAGIFTMLEKDKTFGQVDDQGSESLLQGLLEYEVVHPSRVDPAGHFVSNLVSHRVNRVQRRDTSRTGASLAQVFYHLQLRGQDLLFNLTLNHHLLAPGFLTERRYGGLEGAKIRAHGHSLCHFLGEVWGSPSTWGQAAISTCDGLTGLFKLSQEEFFIRPLEQVSEEGQPQAHVVYKRHTEQPRDPLLRPLSAGSKVNGTCGVEDSIRRAEWQRERWEQRQQRRRVRPRSVSREKWVETLVVADPKMVEYHGSQGVESYALAIMNIVAGLFRDASIGNSINIMVVRLILLEQDEADLKISHHADHSLSSFCKWQKRLNVKGDENPVHHDVAVLLTRKDICAAINKPCETLGLSHVSGMCQPHRSCSISEDTGLPLAFTVAHELGHNFGIQHDGNGNDCEPIGKRPFIMSPQLLYGSAPPNWSRCSRQYITRFLDRGWGWCLDDIPSSKDLALRSLPPGVLYTAAHQCRLQYGSGSLLCDDVDNVCSTLWCTVGNTCHSKLDGAVDGTKCGENKWCYNGECVSAGYRPESVNGGWAPWSKWSACSRTCGVGVQNAQRDCVNPIPVHGGKYCLGERRRYRICNNAPCPSDEPPFRLVQCSRFNTMPYKGKFYKWVQVNNRVNPCELHCRPLNEHFSEKMLDAVIDGTQCYEGTSSRDICINGICKSVGCDYKIDSNAVEDRCGVCHGNGSTCETVKKTFEETEGLGYVDIGLIPEGARDIRIEEVAEAGNFLALRSSDPNKYFLNGGWTIQWNGDYKAAGTVFTYERTGHLENLTSPGPTLEPVWIQLLFQETNPGVRYEYTISRENLVESDNDTVPEFQWRYGSWTDCSATCGTGVQRQIVHCMERTSGIVEEHYCDPATRPDDKRASCNEELCPATWWVGEWQKCSSSCGESGLAKRTVLCIQSVGLEEQRALHPSECQHMPRPDSVVPCNRHLLCPSNWTVGNWSQCSVTCGSGLQSRTVVCSNNTGAACDPRMRPKSDLSCYIQDCPVTVDIFGSDWSGSGSSSREIFNDINSVLDDNHLPIPEKGTARIHPTRHRGDHNNVFEEDLSHSNHIDNTADNSIRNKVLVDDFYYDYNFIRFHEDLSYDFDDKVDTGDSLGFDQKEEPKPASLGSTTDLPTTTSYTLVTSSKNTHNGRALPPGADNDQLITADVEELENIKVQDQLPAGNPGKGGTENEDVFYEEDHFLPVSATPKPLVSITRFSKKWKVSNSAVGQSHDLNTEHSLGTSSRGLTDATVGEDSEVKFTHRDASVFTHNHGTSIGKTGKGSVTGGGEEVDWGGADHKMPADHSNTGDIPEIITGEEWDDKQLVDRELSQPIQGGRDPKDGDGGAPGIREEWVTVEAPASPPPTDSVFHFETYQGNFFHSSPPQWSQALPRTPANSELEYGSQSTASSVQDSPARIFTGEQGSNQYYATESKIESEGTDSWPIDEGNRATFLRSPQEPGSVQTPSDLSDLATGNGESLGLCSEDRTQLVSREDLGDLAVNTATTSSILNTASSLSTTLAPDVSTTVEKTAPEGPWPHPSWPKINFSEVYVPPMLRPGGSDHPLPEQSGNSPGGAGPNRPVLSYTAQPDPTAFWTTGNWSTCSTSCGLGATWRSVRCSTGADSDCAASKRPVPARRCYLRPCSTWRAGVWSKCSRNCGGGVKHREIQCFDVRDQRPLRPFHCQAVAPGPPTRALCSLQACMDWYASSWGQCSEVCGGGEQQRLVTCAEPGKCEESLRPNRIQTCNSQPCAQWVTGFWGQCSASCGGGVRRRLVKCVDVRAEPEGTPEEDPAQCDHTAWPENTEKCNVQECGSPTGETCLRDRLTFRFCQTLQWLGRCHLPTVRAQCCRTCGQMSRGNERSSRR
ncbi:A disintegrin and metalloproteinase with thrombospondin motifs 7 [Scleropages formosus]|uniref:A disintegrin and metalloproteinase with thrombospondin motifs 7 n=1 Tax=Scleropages formosus TaxID=113540 RepID=UPI0010FAC046|nr:A disintegrin and metalloproteinase with thrombospondin motifs 7-like [Scleropages formosus]